MFINGIDEVAITCSLAIMLLALTCNEHDGKMMAK
jgi:hypothetical protein